VSKLRVNALTVSADGFGAGPDHDRNNISESHTIGVKETLTRPSALATIALVALENQP